MGPWRSTRLSVTISGVAPPLRGSAIATTCGEVHGTTTTTQVVPSKLARAQAQAVPSKAHDTKATTQAMSLQGQRVAKPILNLALECATCLAAYSCGFPSSPSLHKTISTIQTYHRAWGILTTFLHGFDISQDKSHARSLPPLQHSRRHIPSKLFQPKW
ncbi:hypothetical protein ACFXTH_000458 [Malus domestica]